MHLNLRFSSGRDLTLALENLFLWRILVSANAGLSRAPAPACREHQRQIPVNKSFDAFLCALLLNLRTFWFYKFYFVKFSYLSTSLMFLWIVQSSSKSKLFLRKLQSSTWFERSLHDHNSRSVSNFTYSSPSSTSNFPTQAWEYFDLFWFIY